MIETDRIFVIEVLRGLAALSVTWFHLTGGFASGWLTMSGAYGWAGVDIFFVVSGVVIPLSVVRALPNYSLADFPAFLARRVMRIEPPYLLSIALVLILGYASAITPGFRGEAPNYETVQLAAHVLYLVPFTEYNWIQPVYWSLAYEFAFYLFIGIAFPWIVGPASLKLCLFGALVLIAMAWTGFLPPRCLLFLLGFLVFRRICSPMGVADMIGVIAVAALATATLGMKDNWVSAIVGATSATTILLLHKVANGAAGWFASVFGALAAISYSLYLMHVPIGGRIINLGQRFAESEIDQLVIALCALAGSIAAAMLFHRWVERPAIALSRQVCGGSPVLRRPT